MQEVFMTKIIHTPEDDESRNLPAIFPGASQRVAVGAASVQSTVLGPQTGLVRVCASTDCNIAFGINPVATATSLYLPAGAIEYFGVNPGEKIAVIQVSTGGFLFITEAL